MEFAQYFPIWDKLTAAQQSLLMDTVTERTIQKGETVHNGAVSCTGVLVIRSGRLRSYILSEDGREVTLYRLFDRDMCLLSASCMLRSIAFEIVVEAEEETALWVIPPETYRTIMEESAPLANYTNEIMASHFSDVMWLVEQILWKSLDKRLAEFLLEEQSICGDTTLKITHEIIGNHLGTAREVITRMLRYFQSEGLVKLTRGTVELTDMPGLARLCGQ